ncbi:MAG: amino acid adenylation domain-containing protein, partial [bacterium]|nr:amino acid adenylation domain-containing protein [bacterium]
RAPLLRAGLIKAGENKHVLIFDTHHIIMDGVSVSIIMKEFSALWNGEKLPPLTTRYNDYVNRTIQPEQPPAAEPTRETHPLPSGSKPRESLNLPLDNPRPPLQSFEGRIIRFEASIEEKHALHRLALLEETTLYTLLLSIFNVFLSKLSGQEDIVVGSPVAGRTHQELEEVVGLFIKTIVLHNVPAGQKTFKQFLKEVKTNVLDTFEKQEYQYEELVEEINQAMQVGRSPLFDVMLVLQNMETPEIKIPGVKVKPLLLESDRSKFDMTLFCREYETLVFDLEYSTRLFEEKTIRRFINYFKTILSAVLENPDRQLSQIAIITEEEKQRILEEFNRTDAEYPRDKTLHRLFEEQAEKTPDNIALADPHGNAISYNELNREANHLALHLTGKGVRPGTIVGIMIGRSIEMVTGIFGILKAGGAYLPIDSTYPHERIDFMLRDSGANVLITGQEDNSNFGVFVHWEQGEHKVTPLRSAFLADGRGVTLCSPLPGMMENAKIRIPAHFTHQSISCPTTLAYIIYTSGSTGKPKGVMIEHGSVVNLALSQTKRFNIDETERVLQFSSISFDASVEQVFIALFSGAVLVLVDKETLLDGSGFGKFLLDQSITHLHAVPSFLETITIKTPSPLRRIISGGDVCSVALAKRLSGYPGCEFYNEYGPTETTVTSIQLKVEDIDETMPRLPIGKPIDNTTVYVLDKWLNPVPIGIAGELYIGGHGVARGYLNRPEFTAKQFTKSFTGVQG